MPTKMAKSKARPGRPLGEVISIGDDLRVRIPKQREVKGLTQPELAAIIGVSNGTMSNYETGRSKQMPKETYARLMRSLWGKGEADDSEGRYKAVVDKLVPLSANELGMVLAFIEAAVPKRP